MTLAQLYDMAAALGLEIDDVPMTRLRAMSFPQGWIAVDLRRFSGEAELKCVLAHEIGHCQTGSFYNVHSSRAAREICERHANRYAAGLLVPLAELRKALHRGIVFNRILARIFDVTLEFINMVLELFEHELIAAARTRVSRREMARAATTNLLPFVRACGITRTG